MASVLYSIRDWERHFEKSQSKSVRSASWVPLPNKHDGKSYRRLMRMPRGMEIYGAWVLIVQVASKCPTRGVLADADGPLTAHDISDKTGGDAEVIQLALDACSDPAIGWISRSEHAGSVLGACSERAGATGQDKTGHGITGQEKTPPTPKGDGGESATWHVGRSDTAKPKVRQPQDRSIVFDPLTVALPPELDTPEFSAAWVEWVTYRKSKRKPLSEMAVGKQLGELIRYGPAAAAAAISKSIKNDWQGIFPEDSTNGIGKRAGGIEIGPGQRFEGDPGQAGQQSRW